MANKFYQPGETRAVKVQDLFASIAPRYDIINDLQSLGLHRIWKRQLLRLARAKPREMVLDLCCGTGDIAFGLAAAGATVVGLDFSAAMLAVARHRSSESSHRQVFFVNGDAMQLPFANAQFDAVTIGYGLRNLADAGQGLREMHRVTKPGGRLLVLDFGKPRQPFLRRCYFGYLQFCVPVFGRVFCRNAAAYGYILESLKHYPAQDGVALLMKQLPCIRLQTLSLLGGIMSINYGEKNS